MNWAYIHLLLNHLPVLGTVFGLALLAYAIVRRNDGLKKVALGVFVAVALLALPVYFTGEPAEKVVENAAGVTEGMVEAHQESALISLIGVELLGIIALVGLFVSRGGRLLSTNLTTAAVVVSLAAAGLMARTANLGGQISHREIRAGATLPAGEHGENETGEGR